MSEAGEPYGGPVLIDNSAWARVVLRKLTADDHERFDRAVRDREIVVSPPFSLEALYSARDAVSFRDLQTELRGFPHAWADDRTWEIAADAQQALAEARAVSHRIKPIDVLLAAIAHQSTLGILHYDHDFDLIRDHTPLDFRSVWIAGRGSRLGVRRVVGLAVDRLVELVVVLDSSWSSEWWSFRRPTSSSSSAAEIVSPQTSHSTTRMRSSPFARCRPAGTRVRSRRSSPAAACGGPRR